MLVAPQTPSQVISGTGDLKRVFVRLREVHNGIACLNFGRKIYEYRGILQVNTINFSLMSEDEQDALIEGFKAFLNGLSFPIQILIKNLPYSLDHYLRTLEKVDGDLADLAQDHANFVRQFAHKRALVKRLFYIVVPSDTIVTRNAADALSAASTQIRLRIEELQRQLERIGLTGHQLQDKEIIDLYQNCYLSEETRQYPFSDELIQGTNRLMTSTRDKQHVVKMEDLEALLVEPEEPSEAEASIAKKKRRKEKKQSKGKDTTKIPDFSTLEELLMPSSVQIFPWYMRIDGETSYEYIRTLSFINYPRSAYPGWLDSIIQIDEPYVDFSIHIKPLDPQQVNSRLGRKAVEFRGSALASQRQGKTLDPTASIALQDIEGLRSKLARGDERIFSISVFVQVRARTRRELGERNNRMMAAIRSLDFRAMPAHWQHVAGFLSCLPDGDNQLGRSRLFGTSSAATFYPFTGSDISMDDGIMFGVHPNGGLVIINPFNSNELENANMVVFAKSGAGKSFFLKTISARLLPTCNVYVVDPEAEYSNLCQRVNGQYVRLSSQSLEFNPFDLYASTGSSNEADKRDASKLDDTKEEGNFFREKLLNLTTLLELLLSDEGSLTQKEKAFLYRCLVKTYENRGITVDPTTHQKSPPNMQEFYVIMSSALRGDTRFGIAEDIHGLSERLERYLHLFPSKTHVILDNRFVDFNVQELNDSLKPVGLFLITEFLWTKMRQARQSHGQPPNTIILIDEAWLLMKFKQGAKFLEEFSRRIRKYGGGLWCTTQNSDDFLNSEEGRTILAMATMKFLMKQDSSTIESVMRTFRLSPGQRNFLLSARRGEGLFATKIWTQIEVVASPKETEVANTTLGAPAPIQDTVPFEQEIVDIENYEDDAEFSFQPDTAFHMTHPQQL
ncbi:ATP-binding protein [Ktedonobacteria bacterium brp13]|nr:ATP-binding protein [Ktedonobacteria bacterium brp13]